MPLLIVLSLLFWPTFSALAEEPSVRPLNAGLENYYQPRKYKEPKKPALRGVKGKDDRQLVENYSYPWSAIGRLNKEIGGFCTATLVAPKLILTAAHCLWNKKRKVWLKPHTIHFLAGYRRGSFIEHSTATRFFIPKGYDTAKSRHLSVAAKDWAFVELKTDLSKQVGTIPLTAVDAQRFDKLTDNKTRFIQAGYSVDKSHILSINKDCRIKSYNAELDIIKHGCDAVSGDSGSPIFYKENGSYKIAYIHMATTSKGKSEGIGISGISMVNHLKTLGLWKTAQTALRP
ncbi:trypsin-like serine protease [Terasakiella sp. SH-1]|uniref:trypsin-like serine peptidase n=1 Tax=Terasakiella sp. SH-1 TaxID=2560057 RepID=UPI0014321D71|nr:trypsin-like serine protease [Terasakiella sp. SH-1]